MGTTDCLVCSRARFSSLLPMLLPRLMTALLSRLPACVKLLSTLSWDLWRHLCLILLSHCWLQQQPGSQVWRVSAWLQRLCLVLQVHVVLLASSAAAVE